ncbi:MAG: PQQ-dependent sugar dehydrogenase [Kibdelosporangium sp.]
MRPRNLIHAAMATALATAAVVALPAAQAAVAPALQPGFVLEDIQTGLVPGLQGDLLTDFAFLPDETLLVTGKYGRINWVPKTGAPRHISTLESVVDIDMGLLGIAVAPDYAASRTIYTARSAPATGPGAGPKGVLRLSRWTVTVDGEGAPTGLTDERIVVQTSADFPVHGISTVIADEDGTLWVSIGDSAEYTSGVVDPAAFRTLDLDDLHGKLLHIRPDGTGVPSNPHYEAANPNSVRSKVYASGFRSPFRFTLDPDTKQPFVGDVGWDTYEEVNLVSPGNSYGWPCWEGTQRAVQYRDAPQCAGVSGVAPTWSYPRSAGSSVIGGVIYQGKNYPAEYQGRYFFGDYAARTLWNLQVDASGAISVPPTRPFGTEVGHVVKIGVMPTGGDLVLGDILDGVLRRLVYSPGNNAPVPVLSATNDPATRKVRFDGEKSWDPNGDTLTYHWEFGDGGTATGAVVEHTYAPGPASFVAKLTLRDQATSASRTLTVYPSNNAPALDVRWPDPNRRYAVGDVIAATASATDQEDGPVQVSWSTNLLHCRGITNCHNHPGAAQPNTPDFRLPFDGHSGDTQLDISATAKDSSGVQTTRNFTVLPRQRRITIDSSTPAEFTLGEEHSTNALFTVGMNVTVTAPETAADGVATFDRWADTPQRQRTLRVPDSDLTLEVEYLTPIGRRYNTDAPVRQALGAPTGVEQGDAQVRWREYQNGRLYWSQSTGVRMVTGEILTRYLGGGGHIEYGLPITDQLTPETDGRGRYNLFQGGRAIYWTPATGARLVRGPIYQKWQANGNVAFNGYPTTDELPTADYTGVFNAFERGYFYWSPATGANEVHGMIHDRWATLGAERSLLGFPTTDESVAADTVGRYNHFQNGSVYWHPSVGAWEVHGLIRDKWGSLGWETSPLGYPTTNESPTADPAGRFNRFQNGSIYWHPDIGAFAVYGLIEDRWAGLGWERSYLGYPTSDEYAWNGLRRSDFQSGYITYDPANGQVVDRRY